MIRMSELWLPVGSFIVIVGTFSCIQVTVWNSARVFFGGDQRFAQVVMFASLSGTIALVVFFMTLDIKLAFLEGIPFLLCYSLVVFSPLFIPALLVVELILVIELTVTRLADPTARRWHVAALACCVAWTVTSIVAYTTHSR
jgi:hypothetical protein